ncbi:Hypothetical protein CINCED_3A020950 [Cinara cedri]|uniref:Uncharacterized protein n=1 Tax=Cinara cedri TaxID=506608 RepID=A0A5E4M3V4_9HEMI|nr:Hypothetical protein CINCED_3A020950 [Cinara cedri]
MDNLECSDETAVAAHQSNEQNPNQIDNAWKNIFDTLDRKILESDGVDATVTHEQVQENNNDNNTAIVSSHPAIEFVPSHNYRLVEDSVGVDHTEDSAITVESIMERENHLFKELSTVEHSALNYFKNYWTNFDKKSKTAAASSTVLSKPTESVSEIIKNVEDTIEADFITAADSTITKCPSVELIMERKDNLFKKLSEIEHNMINYFKNFRTKVKVHSEPAAATTAVALTAKTESDPEIDIDNGSYVDVNPDRAQTVVQATFESTEKIAPALGGDYEGGDCCNRNRGNNWIGNNDESTALSPLGMNGGRDHDDNGDEKYCNEERYYTESSVDSSEQFEMSNGEKYLEIDLHHYSFSSTVEKPNKRDHHQKSNFYYYFVDDDQYESMDEEHPCSQNLWRPLDNSREQYETTNKTRRTRKRTRYQQKVNHRSDYVADDNHCSNEYTNNNEDRDHWHHSLDDGGRQLIDKKPKKLKKCRRLTKNINK